MYDTDEDVTPVDDEGNNLPNLSHLEDEESYISNGRPTEVEENFDNEENDYEDEEECDYEDEEDFPPVLRDKFSGVPRSIRMLETFYNPCPHDEWEDAKGEAALYKRAVKLQEAAPIATIYDGSPEPKTNREEQQCIDIPNWREAMCIESDNMEQKKFWEIIPKTKVPAGRKFIGARWVLARKDDGRYRAKCVAKGFSQIPGTDFQENFAPVISDTTLHLLMVIKTVIQLEAGQFDI
jgi:hypothetical protein